MSAARSRNAAESPHETDAASVRAQGCDTVLVVDDNEVSTLVAAVLLEQLGWGHESVTDGQQALQAMARQRFAAVLMDCHMPVLDGWEATRRWRATGAGGRLPIIGVTGNATSEDRQSCLEAGMDDHLPKPFEKAALGEVLQRSPGRGRA